MAAAVAASAAKRIKATSVITFVTGNANKLREVKTILGDGFPFEVTSRGVDLPELQGEPDEVAREKCRLASESVKGPVMVEDVSLCFNALGGLPGVYIKWFLQKLGHDGLNRMLAGWEDKSAKAVCTYAFCAGPGKEIHIFPGIVEGTIVPARGPPDFGWDAVFEPKGSDKTYAELDSETKNRISHRGAAIRMLKAFLEERGDAVLGSASSE
ncbi:hypothetical protein FNF27_07590 [Cafeteria roenbergensis]|uniref:Inosine triphosphate pyrophosphatase n=2 Tax=Cafeteria roenbergensis TaxID=33653 RepID=A0A5A8C1C7_CAFRO|nr:hypothetical protein FNF28_07657 [Cafeteria roenbergensis]KAA0147803.1 hypothetical protein FNF29_07147 [Cafeteria roenbergensis]KAA0164062.1 hypothetical protein FNF31_02611 [Cafeteria roenbergensis]KAA0165674.1 hypothetical protein FNF27_07590 [Cafeteria roenbergensis]|eukprot:KAA0147803.1 hypothetical protein FNF29_07147 [Cafeteria roenbergensis]